MKSSDKEMGAIKWVSVIPAHSFTYDGLYSNSNVKCRLSIAQHTNIYFTHTATNCALTGDGDLPAGCGIWESIEEDVISWHSVDSGHIQMINVWLSGDTTSNWNLYVSLLCPESMQDCQCCHTPLLSSTVYNWHTPCTYISTWKFRSMAISWTSSREELQEFVIIHLPGF
jgi:hypothetical protein